MARNIVGVIVGLTAAAMVIWSIEMVNYSMFPLPEGLDHKDKDAMAEHIKTLPAAAFLIVILAHVIGAFIGAWVASLIADTQQFRISMGIGLFLTVMGIITLTTIPHPIWFSILDSLVYLPSSYMGYLLYKKRKS